MSDSFDGHLYRWIPGWTPPPRDGRTAPVLVVALEGWVDAGAGASAALGELLQTAPTRVAAEFDTALLLDQRARRPVARLVDGVTTELVWPTISLVATTDRLGADVYYLTGSEPDFRWNAFTQAIVEIVNGLGIRIVVGLGAFPAPAPHTRPVRLAATAPASSAALARRVGVVQGTIEVPAGVQAALEMALGTAGIPVVGLWARVPHYVSAMPYPEAAAALIGGLCSVSGLVFDATPLREAAADTRRQVNELVAGNPEHRDMVRRLELAVDSEENGPVDVEEVPSGDEIAAELEKFLREQGS